MPNEYQPLLTNDLHQMNSHNATDDSGLYQNQNQNQTQNETQNQSQNPRNKINFMTSLKNTCKSSSLNILLIFIVFGILSKYLNMSDTSIFLCNFIAIIPLAKLLGFATEDLSLRTSETIGGLLNATFGNAVEVIIGIMALKNGLTDVVKASMVGSLLSNLLLVLGMCFLFGGIKYKFQTFNTTTSDTSASLLVMTIFMVVLPVAFNYEDENKIDVEEREISFSRYTSIIILIVYGLFLLFQLKTHARYFKTNNNSNQIFAHTNSMEYESLSNQRRIEEEGRKQISQLSSGLNKEQQLFKSSEKGYIYAIKKLLKEGVNINAKDSSGWTALIWASRDGHIEVVRELIERGADINAKANDKRRRYKGGQH